MAAALAPALAIAAACATPVGSSGSRYHFFSEARRSDPWFEKVAAWQARARRDATTISEARNGDQGAGLIRVEMGRFRDGEKRSLARRINTWAQDQARKHYFVENDVDPANDRWPTFRELLERNGDDCDGLDLMTYELLREFGFRDVYRAIVRRDRNGSNHMVTLWFEDRDDPWVLDATGAILIQMRRFSEIPDGWTPTQVFDETRQFRATAAHPLARRGPEPDDPS